MTIQTLTRDTGLVFAREVRPLLREPFQMIISVLQPLMFLALFAPALASLAHVAAALTSTLVALALAGVPYNLGLIVAAASAGG